MGCWRSSVQCSRSESDYSIPHYFNTHWTFQSHITSLPNNTHTINTSPHMHMKIARPITPIPHTIDLPIQSTFHTESPKRNMHSCIPTTYAQVHIYTHMCRQCWDSKCGIFAHKHTHTHTHTCIQPAFTHLEWCRPHEQLFQGWVYVCVDNIAPSIHDHREPQRRNKQTPHLAHHTCTYTGTKYKHTSIEHCDKSM